MLQALSGPTACWAGLLCVPCWAGLLRVPCWAGLLRVPCWAGLRRGRRPAREPSALRAFGSARRLEARPGPATTHGHRSQALRSLRRPPHRWRQRPHTVCSQRNLPRPRASQVHPSPRVT